MNKKVNNMKKFSEFIYGVFSSGTPESGKRLFGAIGFTISIVYIAIWSHDLIQDLLYTSAMLLGLETISNIFNNKISKK